MLSGVQGKPLEALSTRKTPNTSNFSPQLLLVNEFLNCPILCHFKIRFLEQFSVEGTANINQISRTWQKKMCIKSAVQKKAGRKFLTHGGISMRLPSYMLVANSRKLPLFSPYTPRAVSVIILYLIYLRLSKFPFSRYNSSTSLNTHD